MLRIDKRISEILQTALFILGPNGRKLACTQVCIFEHGSLKRHLKCLALIVVAINSFIALGYHVVVACGFTVIIRKTKVFVLVTFASPPRTLNR